MRSIAESRDLRSGGRWTLTQRAKNALIRAAAHALLLAVDRVPPRTLLAIGRVLGRACALTMPRLRRVAERRALAALGPDRARSVARDCFVRAGESAAWCALLRRAEFRALDVVAVPPDARRALSDALALGHGAVVMSAHLGPFELTAAAVAELGHAPAVVVRESYDPDLDRVVDAHRVLRGVRVIHRGAKGAPFEIARALRDGRPVGILADLPSRGTREALDWIAGGAFPTAPAQLAARLGAPLLACWLEGTGGGPIAPFALRIEHVSDGQPAVVTRRVMTLLEAAIRRDPANWLWMAEPALPPVSAHG